MDWLGGFVLAAVAAIGGGTVRDLLLGETPAFWVQDEWPLVVRHGLPTVEVSSLIWLGGSSRALQLREWWRGRKETHQ